MPLWSFNSIFVWYNRIEFEIVKFSRIVRGWLRTKKATMKHTIDLLQQKKWLFVVLVALSLGYVIGNGVNNDRNGSKEPASIEPVESEAPKGSNSAPSPFKPASSIDKRIYICPMNCVPPMEKPGICPVCGMELVEAMAQEHRHEPGPTRIRFPEEAIRRAGLMTAPVEEQFVTAEVRLFGKIEYDPVEQYMITAFAPGVIDRIYVKRAGQSVRTGDPLFDMHSSELFFLEQELFEVLKLFPDSLDYRPARGQRYRRLMRPAYRKGLSAKDDTGEVDETKAAALEKIDQIQRKMMLLGLEKTDIENVMARGRPTGISTVTTPITGIVLEQNAFKGSYVNTGETIFNIANPRYMWARLDAYESDFPWIRIGQTAEFETDAFPGETFSGKVTYLDPYFDPNTRTFKVGVLYMDPKARLKPNMLVRCSLQAQLTAEGVRIPGRQGHEKAPLVIPETAPLITGKRAVVYVEVPHQPDTYESREVMLGPRAKGYYVVKAGLHKGERVVVNGNFKIDSAVQILAKPSMMEPDGGQATGGDHHSGMQPAGSTGADEHQAPMQEMTSREPADSPSIPKGNPNEGSAMQGQGHDGHAGGMPMKQEDAPIERNPSLHGSDQAPESE